jgi:DNA-binding NarL/FixJ family response regulator
MKHFFVDSSGKLRDRWLQAFPDARVVREATMISDVTVGGAAVVWVSICGMSTPEARSAVRTATNTAYPVVAMSATPQQAEAFHLLNAGAVGYCHIEAAPEQLREISLVIGHGGLWLPPELMQRLLAVSVRSVPTDTDLAPQLNALTARELKVAEQVAKGASNREISAALDISERTVKAHLSAIFKKLDVRDRVQLALAMNNLPIYTTIN